MKSNDDNIYIKKRNERVIIWFNTSIYSLYFVFIHILSKSDYDILLVQKKNREKKLIRSVSWKRDLIQSLSLLLLLFLYSTSRPDTCAYMSSANGNESMRI